MHNLHTRQVALAQPTQIPSFRDIIYVARWILSIILFYASLKYAVGLLPLVETHYAINHVEAKYELDIAGLRYISTWQLCNFIRVHCPWQHQCIDPDCGEFNSHPLNEARLDIFANAPGLKYNFSIGERPYSIEPKIDQHLELAQGAVSEMIYRFPINTNTLQYTRYICTDLPRFNATVANILPWYDLFEDWDRKLDFKINLRDHTLAEYRPQLEDIQAHIRHALQHIHKILEVRNSERFEQLVAKYEQVGCGRGYAWP